MRNDLPISLNEFRAWLEGYSDTFHAGFPDAEQWYRIMDRLDQISNTSKVYTSEPQLFPDGLFDHKHHSQSGHVYRSDASNTMLL